MVPAVKPEDMSPDPKVVCFISVLSSTCLPLGSGTYSPAYLSAWGPVLAVNVPTIACVDVY